MRRHDAEQQWLDWGQRNTVVVCILRVPGIYAFSRLPRSRIESRTPVVSPSECGYTNRIHADDLAQICTNAMQYGQAGEVYNTTDGTPGKISDYLQQVAKLLGVQALPEISMQQARQQLSQGMLSYLGESRKISNRKMLRELNVVLRYPDYVEGLKN
jgi:nucleoside-diphosphate-sugar epimerase